MNRPLFAFITFIFALGVPAIAGQQPQKAEPAPAAQADTSASRGVPVRVQFVVARYKGDKKITSLPYTLSAATGQMARLRVGADVPYATTTFRPVKPAGESTKPGDTTQTVETVQSHSYRTVGINISCTPSAMADGRYRLDIALSDDSIAYDDAAASRPKGVPVFRTFSTTNTLVLEDGETDQITSAADPTSGEILRVDVTLTVAK